MTNIKADCQCRYCRGRFNKLHWRQYYPSVETVKREKEEQEPKGVIYCPTLTGLHSSIYVGSPYGRLPNKNNLDLKRPMSYWIPTGYKFSNKNTKNVKQRDIIRLLNSVVDKSIRHWRND